jgi:hypothetical protein
MAATADTLLTSQQIASELASAQRATFSKAAMEISDLRYIFGGAAPETWPADEIALWASAGQVLYGIGKLSLPEEGIVITGLPRDQLEGAQRWSRITTRPPRRGDAPPPRVLDDQSRQLVSRLHDAVPLDMRATTEQKTAMIMRLEQNLVADSAINQLRLRPQISTEIIRTAGRANFDALNAFVYKQVFRTPKEDAWLGLLPRTDFTGIPGDGVVMR